jgi:hypothetical protein
MLQSMLKAKITRWEEVVIFHLGCVKTQDDNEHDYFYGDPGRPSRSVCNVVAHFNRRSQLRVLYNT